MLKCLLLSFIIIFLQLKCIKHRLIFLLLDRCDTSSYSCRFFTSSSRLLHWSRILSCSIISCIISCITSYIISCIIFFCSIKERISCSYFLLFRYFSSCNWWILSIRLITIIWLSILLSLILSLSVFKFRGFALCRVFEYLLTCALSFIFCFWRSIWRLNYSRLIDT